MDIAHNQSKALALKMVASSEQAIFNAVNGTIGEDWSLGDLEGRLVRKIMPDRSEIITLDGKDLLQFMPVEFTTEWANNGWTVKATQAVRDLSR